MPAFRPCSRCWTWPAGSHSLSELEKTPATAVTKAQAKQLLPLLQKLTTAASISPADATKTLTQLEDKILSDKQVTALDDLDLKRQEERRAQRAKSGGSAQGGGLRIPGVPVRIGAQGQNRPAGQAQGGQQAGQRPGGFGSGPFNPFKQGRQADALKKYIAVSAKEIIPNRFKQERRSPRIRLRRYLLRRRGAAYSEKWTTENSILPRKF